MYKLTKEEFELLIPERNKDLLPTNKVEIFVEHPGNFSVIIIKEKGKYFVGVTKRNPCDRESNEVGLQIAAIRALKELYGLDPGYGRQRPTSKKEAKRTSAIDKYGF